MNKKGISCLYVIFLYWLYRAIAILTYGLAAAAEYPLDRFFVLLIFGFLFSDLAWLPAMPFIIYIFFSHVKDLQEVRTNWYSYLSWKPLIISIIAWLMLYELAKYFMTPTSSGRNPLRAFGPFEGVYVFWVWFILATIIFLIFSSLLWYYFMRDYFNYDQDLDSN